MAADLLSRREPLIHDAAGPNLWTPPPGLSRGLDLRSKTTAGYAGVAEPFPAELLIPRTEWRDRIAEMERDKSRLSDLIVRSGLPCKDQNGTNYCWVNAPTHCVEILRVLQNEPTVPLSPASAGGPIKGYANVGGWGREALEYIVEKGLVPVDRWPANAINSRYNTAENRAIALDYRADEWFALDDGDLDQLISCVLRRIPVAVGYNWWGHEVTAVDAVWIDGQVALRIRNSWGMAWGEQGFGILQGRRMLPDDAVAPRTALAS